MSIVVRFKPANLTREKYDAVVSKLDESDDNAPDGRDYHVLFGPEDNLMVSEIWDSPEKFQAYGETLMPVLQEAGIEFSGEPEVFEGHNVIKR
jgi:hypothetical protein